MGAGRRPSERAGPAYGCSGLADDVAQDWPGRFGAGLTKAMDRVRHRPEEAAARPSGRKHGHRAVTVTAFTPVEIRRRVAPPV